MELFNSPPLPGMPRKIKRAKDPWNGSLSFSHSDVNCNPFCHQRFCREVVVWNKHDFSFSTSAAISGWLITHQVLIVCEAVSEALSRTIIKEEGLFCERARRWVLRREPWKGGWITFFDKIPGWQLRRTGGLAFRCECFVFPRVSQTAMERNGVRSRRNWCKEMGDTASKSEKFLKSPENKILFEPNLRI